MVIIPTIFCITNLKETLFVLSFQQPGIRKMINRIVSFFILCLVLCIPLCVAYFHSGELMMRFVFFWPFFMSSMWIVGGVYFWVYRERHWPWGENAPAPQLKDNPSISIIIPCFNEEKNVEETIHAALAQRVMTPTY